MPFYIFIDDQPVNIDDPAQRSPYAPNVVPACCVRCGVSRLADNVKWERVEGEWVCDSCRKKGEADNG